MFNILIADHLDESGLALLAAAPNVNVQGPFELQSELETALSTTDALIIRSETVVDRALLTLAPNLKVIGRAGARLNNVDIEAVTARGVMVCHVPDAHIEAVAEHTMAMLLAAARRIPQAYHQLQTHQSWARHTTLGFELRGRTLGVIGYGRIGRRVTALASAFGMQLLAYDPSADPDIAKANGVTIVPLDELLHRSDVVSLHVNVTPETQHIINAATLAKMRPTAWLVNCSHAELVDETALTQALNNGSIAGAALDTLTQEPPAPDHPLLQHPRTVIVPHLNQNTVEAREHTSITIAQQVLDALEGRDYTNFVNLPFTTETAYKHYQPYLLLAEKLGRLQGHLANPARIRKLEVEVQGEGLEKLIRPIAVALLKGMLRPVDGVPITYANAPMIAHAQGIQMQQTLGLRVVDYPNLISCRVHWDGGSQTLAGVLFAGDQVRLVQYGDIRIDARPEGNILFLENHDRPGIIGEVGTILGNHAVNIAGWRYGRNAAGDRSVSFINLDSRCPQAALAEVKALESVIELRYLRLM